LQYFKCIHLCKLWLYCQSIYKEIEETIQDAIYGRHFVAEKIEENKIKENEANEREAKEKEAKEKRKLEEPPPLEDESLPGPPEKKGPNDNEKEPIIKEDKCIQVIVPEEVKNLIPYFRVLWYHYISLYLIIHNQIKS